MAAPKQDGWRHAYVLLNVVLSAQQSLRRGATPAPVSAGRCQSFFCGEFAGGLEDDQSGNLDGVVDRRPPDPSLFLSG